MASLKLINRRNSCYINTGLQILFLILKIRNFFLNKLYLHPSKKGNQPVCEALFSIFSQPGRVQNVESLRSKMAESYPNYAHFNSSMMWDAEEFLLALLDCIDQEICENGIHLTEEGNSIVKIFQGTLDKTNSFIERHSPWCINDTTYEDTFQVFNIHPLLESTGQMMTVQQLVDKQMSNRTNIILKKCSNCNFYVIITLNSFSLLLFFI